MRPGLIEDRDRVATKKGRGRTDIDIVHADWLIRGNVRIPPGLVLSFQRFAWPVNGVVDRAPSSLGALPVGIGAASELLLPLACDESFWVGLEVSSGAPAMALAVTVQLRNGEVLDVFSGSSWDAERPRMAIVGTTPRIEGIRRRDGRVAVFVRETHASTDIQCDHLRFRVTLLDSDDSFAGTGAAAAREVQLRLVDYAAFAAETGLRSPNPLDQKAGYKGWLLP
jgi:hypothetical protein